jgi:hypothetical protein
MSALTIPLVSALDKSQNIKEADGMVKVRKSNKSKKSNQAKRLNAFARAKKKFQNVKDKDLGEGLINLTVGLIALSRNSKRPNRQRFHNGKQTWPWPWSQLHRSVQRRLG